MINELKKIFGPKCSAININGDINEFINIPSKKMKFCEAVYHSFDIPLRLTNDNLTCPGARRCVGFDYNDPMLSETISVNNKIPLSFILNTLKTISVLQGINHINLGMTGYMEEKTLPDLYILYIRPVQVTTLIHFLAKQNIIPSIPPYSLLSVCGNVFTNCVKSGSASISFGCPESRKYGGIKEQEIVLGLPYNIAQLFVSEIAAPAF